MLFKSLWEKNKLRITSIFLFFPRCFKTFHKKTIILPHSYALNLEQYVVNLEKKLKAKAELSYLKFQSPLWQQLSKGFFESRENTGNQHLILFSTFETFKPFPKQALVFTCLQYKSLENTKGKEEIACNKQFLLFS